MSRPGNIKAESSRKKLHFSFDTDFWPIFSQAFATCGGPGTSRLSRQLIEVYNFLQTATQQVKQRKVHCFSFIVVFLSASLFTRFQTKIDAKDNQKGAGYSDSLRKTTEELSAMGTSRHPKVPKSGPNHGCQWIFKLKMSRRHKTAPMAQKLP